MQKQRVIAVNCNSKHTFSKENRESVKLVKNFGVEGDAHAGETVKHRSRVAQNPNQPNLRQVHLIHSELFVELSAKGFDVNCGQMGENITTENIELLNLPRHTVLKIGSTAEIQITGLRNPCKQLDEFQNGLLRAVLDNDKTGELVRKAGVMAIVLEGGEVKPGDLIEVKLPNKPFEKLERV
jgi:MOSC domain-containing protein YiiM